MGKDLREQTVDLYPKIVYYPKGEINQTTKFREFVEKKHGVQLNDYWELQKWSRENYPEFWECIWLFFDIIHSVPYMEVFDRSRGFDNMEWFKGARLNYAENALRNRGSTTAIITVDETDKTEYISYENLYIEVCAYAEALKESGVQKGDVLACYMSNKVEAIYAHLAAASLGVLWCAAQPLLGPKAVLARLQQVKPKILFTSGSFSYEGKAIHMLQKISVVVEGLPSLKKVIFVSSKTTEEEAVLSKYVSTEVFLKAAKTKLDQNGYKLCFEQVPFDYPFSIDFTSGTTGPPKALIHSQGSFLTSIKDLGLHWDCTKEDVLLNCISAGWVTFNMHVAALQFGLTLVLYDGSPFQESSTRYFDLVDRFQITCTVIWSSAIESMELKNHVPTKNHSLASLKILIPTGNPCKPQSFDFITEKIKPGLLCTPDYGSTEFYGSYSGMNTNLPIYKGEIQCFTLGSDFRLVDEKGNYLIGKRGNFVVCNPCPSLPIASIGEDSKTKIKDTYLSRFPGHWDMGDDAWINPVTGGFIVYGRSDETMNPKGRRFSCSEIYFALEEFPGLLDSVCVSQFNSKMDERVVLFVKMAPGHTITPQVITDIKKKIEDDLSYYHVPELIMEVPDVPYNINGKKMNGLVKNLINRRPVANTDVALNSSSVDYFKNLELGDF